jgi:hypothetical protein
VYPVGDLVVPLAQVGQAIQADAEQVLLALGPDPLKTDFQLLMRNGMSYGGFNTLPGIPEDVQFMTALQMRMAGQMAAAPAAIASSFSNGVQQLGLGMNALYGSPGPFGGFGGVLGSDMALLNLIHQVVGGTGLITIGTPHFGGIFPVNGGRGGGFGLGGLGYGGGYGGGGGFNGP